MSGHPVITKHILILKIATNNIYRICGDAEETSLGSSYFTDPANRSGRALPDSKSSVLTTDQPKATRLILM